MGTLPVRPGLTTKHALVAEWLLLNPDAGLRECARALGYTKAWVAQVVASDSFQAYYAKRAQEVGQEAAFVLRARTQALQMLAVEHGIELFEQDKASERLTLEVLRSVMEVPPGNGGPKQGGVEQHVHLHISAADLAEARQLMSAARDALPPVPRKLEAPTVPVPVEVAEP